MQLGKAAIKGKNKAGWESQTDDCWMGIMGRRNARNDRRVLNNAWQRKYPASIQEHWDIEMTRVLG